MARGIILGLLCVLLVSAPALSLDGLTGFVNDEADVISPEFEASLNSFLLELKQNTSVEFAIATVKTTGGIPIEEYSINLAHDTLGDEKKDNGLLLLLAVDDRAYRIEVGYGLEPVISASLAGRIGRQYMEPHFKEGNYEQGILEGFVALSKVILEDDSIETEATEEKKKYNTTFLVIFMIFALFIVFSVISNYQEEKRLGKRINAHDKRHDDDFNAAALAAILFGRGRGGGGFSGGGNFGGFGGGSFGGGGFSGKF